MRFQTDKIDVVVSTSETVSNTAKLYILCFFQKCDKFVNLSYLYKNF